MAKKKVWFTVEVEPKSAGDFGFARIGNMKYKEWQLDELAEQISRDIKRHVDNVGRVNVSWEYEEGE